MEAFRNTSCFLQRGLTAEVSQPPVTETPSFLLFFLNPQEVLHKEPSEEAAAAVWLHVQDERATPLSHARLRAGCW